MTALPLSSQAKRRAEAYWFLSSLFAAPPSVDMLSRMAPLAGEPGDDVAGAILATLGGEANLGHLAERLAVEHTRLFGGLQEGYGPPPPWESLWREGRLMGDATVAVAEAYLAAGYSPSGEWSPFDHIVEELRFLASLCNGEHEFAARGRTEEASWARQRQEMFLRDHLLAWVPAFASAVAEAAREPFHRSLALATAEVLTEDARRFAETDPT